MANLGLFSGRTLLYVNADISRAYPIRRESTVDQTDRRASSTSTAKGLRSVGGLSNWNCQGLEERDSRLAEDTKDRERGEMDTKRKRKREMLKLTEAKKDEKGKKRGGRVRVYVHETERARWKYNE